MSRGIITAVEYKMFLSHTVMKIEQSLFRNIKAEDSYEAQETEPNEKTPDLSTSE